jgi:hypothetical protein
MEKEDHEDPNEFLTPLQARVLEAVDQHPDPKDGRQDPEQDDTNEKAAESRHKDIHRTPLVR